MTTISFDVDTTVTVDIDIDEHRNEILDALEVANEDTWDEIVQEFRLFGRDAGIRFVLDGVYERTGDRRFLGEPA